MKKFQLILWTSLLSTGVVLSSILMSTGFAGDDAADTSQMVEASDDRIMQVKITESDFAEKIGLSAQLIKNQDAISIIPRDLEAPIPPASEVDMILRLTNEADKSWYINLGSDMERWHFKLKGEGAEKITAAQMFTMEMRMGRWHEVKAGETFDIDVRRLNHGHRRQELRSLAGTAGDYQLDMSIALPMSATPVKMGLGEETTKVHFVVSDIALKGTEGKLKYSEKTADEKRNPWLRYTLVPMKSKSDSQLADELKIHMKLMAKTRAFSMSKDSVSKADMVLLITNASDEPLWINEGSDMNKLDMILTGNGKILGLEPVMVTEEFRMGRWIKVTRDKPYQMNLKELRYGHRMTKGHIITEPGAYNLKVNYTVIAKKSEKGPEHKLTFNSKNLRFVLPEERLNQEAGTIEIVIPGN